MAPISLVSAQLGRMAFWLSLSLLLGRLLGFIREIAIARLLGVSAQSDQAIILLALPDLFVNVLLAGGLSGALIPALSKKSGANRIDLMFQCLSLVCVLFVPISAWVALYPDLIIKMLAPEAVFSDSFTGHVRWIGLAILTTALSGVFAALLNAENRFFIAGSGGLIFNTTILSAIFVYLIGGGSSLLSYLTVGVVVAGFLRLLSTAIPYFGALETKRRIKFSLPNRVLMGQFLFALGAVGLVQMLPVLIRAFATGVEPGALTAFNYAQKLIELPIGVALSSIGIVILPTLAACHMARDRVQFNEVMFLALKKSFILSMVLLVGSLLLLPWAVVFLFGGGAMTMTGLKHTRDLALIIVWTLPLVGLSNVLAAALNAMSKQAILIICSLFSLLASVGTLQGVSEPGYYDGLGISMIVFYIVFLVTTAIAVLWFKHSEK